MSSIANPMDALIQFQDYLSSGMPIDPTLLVNNYLEMYEEPGGGRRFSFAKILENEIQALAIFGLEDHLNEILCYNVGYAVSENHRGRGLAIEAIKIGLARLKDNLKLEGVSQFYLEAVIEHSNIYSIKIAEKILNCKGVEVYERESGKPALHFKKLINI